MIRRALVPAPAKINLWLHVGARRADGFHELDTLFQSVGLLDLVHVEVTPDGPHGEVSLDVRGADLGPIDENLAYRAADSFLALAGAPVSVRLTLEKAIPAGAGLGGGSSDAAAVLRGLDALLGGVPSDRLHIAAAELGSDVPFFLGPRPLARGRGRGEVLEPLPSLPPAALVIGLPPVHVGTPEAYGALAEARAGGRVSRRDPRVAEAETPTGWADVIARAHNDFEPIVASRHAEVARTLEGLRSAGASVALLSGSGAASFGVFEGADVAQRVAEELTAEMGWPFLATTTLDELPPITDEGAP